VTSPITPPAPDPNPSIAKRKPVMLAAALAAILPVIATILGILDVDPEIIAAVTAVSAVVVGAVNKWAASRVYSVPTVTALLAATPDRPPAPPPPTSLADVSAVAPGIHPVTLAALAAPTPSNPEVLTAAVYSNRLNAWSTVYLHPEANPDEGTFVMTDATYAGLPVAQYVPGASATHTPIGPDEQARMGLRPIIRPPDAEGN
jgi:hypothetical protein